MKDGIITLGTALPPVHLANPAENAREILCCIRTAAQKGVQILAFPELSITGYSCGDLFFQSALLNEAKHALLEIARQSAEFSMLIFVGLPLEFDGKLYNCAAAISGGQILGIVPKKNVPGYGAFSETRWFTPYSGGEKTVFFGEAEVPAGDLLFQCTDMPSLTVGAEIGADLFAPEAPSVNLCRDGASVIVNLAAMPETASSEETRRLLVRAQSTRLLCAYLYANCGTGESTTDTVFSGHSLITAGGRIAAENLPFEKADCLTAQADLNTLLCDRRRMNLFPGASGSIRKIPFSLAPTENCPDMLHNPAYPFIPADTAERTVRCRRILEIQAHGLASRLRAAHANGAVIAVSGGLDSCLALLVTARAFDLLEKPRSGITTVTMPCYGTTRRTKSNARILSEELETSFREIDIAEAVALHFRDIGHSAEDHSVVYENAQARERTQIIMDIANADNSLVIGTGDLSELALGWATYNGDHMSSYGVNAGIPKTLIRHIVSFCADEAEQNAHPALAAVLRDILATPVSPELLPAKDGEISQKTEDIVGPYDLHDFFLYHMVRRGENPAKIYRLARAAFAGKFDDATIRKWLKIFCRRFFTQQFKRSCLPDGPKIGSVSFSPRGDWHMPSDAQFALWTAECDSLEDL